MVQDFLYEKPTTTINRSNKNYRNNWVHQRFNPMVHDSRIPEIGTGLTDAQINIFMIL